MLCCRLAERHLWISHYSSDDDDDDDDGGGEELYEGETFEDLIQSAADDDGDSSSSSSSSNSSSAFPQELADKLAHEYSDYDSIGFARYARSLAARGWVFTDARCGAHARVRVDEERGYWLPARVLCCLPPAAEDPLALYKTVVDAPRGAAAAAGPRARMWLEDLEGEDELAAALV